MHHNYFDFYTYDEDGPTAPIKEWKEVAETNSFLEAEDHVHVRGFSGIFTNGTKDASFDMFKIQPLVCWNEEPLSDEFWYRATTCNRQKEVYSDSLPVNWQIMEPKLELNPENGPSAWSFEEAIEKRLRVIY